LPDEQKGIFDDDGQSHSAVSFRMALTLKARDCPGAVFLLLMLSVIVMSHGCSAFDLINAPIQSWGYQVSKDVDYGFVGRQKLDVYRPVPGSAHRAGDVKAGMPVVIFFYGGGWRRGEKRNYRFVAEALVSRGFVVVLPDYRVFPEAVFPEFVQDGALAVRWVKRNIAAYGGDADRVYLMGHSAGAHIVALLTLDGRYLEGVGLERGDIRASVGIAGPYDFDPYAEDNVIFNMAAGKGPRNPQVQPVNFVDGHAPPMLLMHGLMDDLVDPANSVELAAAIQKAGGQVRLVTYSGLDHRYVLMAMAWQFRWLGVVREDLLDFLDAQGAGGGQNVDFGLDQ
jgi:acetyl esterase/lipase